MCIEIHHLLACGHYNPAHPTPYQIVECLYPSLSGSEKKYWDRVNVKGKHELLGDGAQSFDYDYNAVCEQCREMEIARLARGEMVRWPSAKGTGEGGSGGFDLVDQAILVLSWADRWGE
jgi:hypothetical protein